MKTAYIDYSMSVIVSRALPDVRDGLKPVHRRVLFGMSELGITHNKSHKKSARIVGEVLGKYHPHGDSSVYDTMVRMAQDWSLRYPLVDGQGNFGSADGDNPAAMRYTEARLKRISDEAILADLDKDTVDFQLNFDDSLEEPSVMPAILPNLLVNGSSGIAVGMATNMMPHNLSEVIDGISAFVDNGEMTCADLMKHIKAPDFPSGGIIYGIDGIKEGFETGRGRVVLRAKCSIEVDSKDRASIVVTEVPYQVNRSSIMVKIAELVNEKKIEGISDIRDESDRDGTRMVVELKREANPNVVLSLLYKYTPLQTSYGINNICLVGGRPRVMNLRGLVSEYVKFRLEVVNRRTLFELRKALERAHILKALIAALDRLDEIISLIRASRTTDIAREALMNFDFTPKGDALTMLVEGMRLENDRLDEIQAKAILEMRLQRLTGMEREKLRDEYLELVKLIEKLNAILASEQMRRDIIKEELASLKDRFGDSRRTQIEYADGEIRVEDMIDNEELMVSISHFGYVKATQLAEYKSQGRGGRGSKGSATREEDFIETLFSAKAHDYLLLFTEKGKCFWIRVYELPKGGKGQKGRVIHNVVQLDKEDKVKAYIVVENLTDPEFLKSHYIIFCTREGIIKKTSLEDYSRPRTNGITAIGIREGDMLLEARLTDGDSHIFLASRNGKAIRFHEGDVRDMGRGASGVKGMNLADDEDDVLVGMVCVKPEQENVTILAIAAKGIGKRTDLDEYRLQTRGGKGVKTMNINEKTGKLVALKDITDADDLMIINTSGIAIRLEATSLPTSGRATQGVKLINLKGNDSIADVALIRNADRSVEGEEELEGDANASAETTNTEETTPPTE